MAKYATAKKETSAWGWQTPNGKTSWQTFKTRGDAAYNVEYEAPKGSEVIRVWVKPATAPAKKSRSSK